MMASVLQVEGLNKCFDGIRALTDFSCSVGEREILGFIGPNGAGKTTFFNVITGFIRPDGGKASLRGADLLGMPPYKVARAGVARTFQILRLIRRMSVLENVLLAFPNQPGERFWSVFLRPRASARQETANRKAARALLEEVGLAEKRDDPADALSYGQQKLLGLACALIVHPEPKLLLLDEPVAGVNRTLANRLLDLVRTMNRTGKTFIVIEHDMPAIMGICDKVIVLDHGKKIAEGKPQEIQSNERVIEAYFGR